MDREQEELQFLGFFGILKESFNIIFSRRKIFSQITLGLVVPLSLICLAHAQISRLVVFNILGHQITLDDTEVGTQNNAKLSHIFSSEWTAFWLFEIPYFTFLLILSLLSTAEVVYTVACMYTAEPLTFKKLMSVVPKVWKRLMATLLWSFVVVFVYNVIAAGFLLLWAISLGNRGGTIGIVLLVVLLILYVVGFLYITIVWHLACVISVLEDNYGIKAMVKSKNLIKGKIGVAVAVFLTVGICFIAVQVLYESFLVFGWLDLSLGLRIGIGILCIFLLLKVFLFSLVLQTVVYFVCKSYHHQYIDKLSLAGHLESYLGDYVRLDSKTVQLEQTHA